MPITPSPFLHLMIGHMRRSREGHSAEQIFSQRATRPYPSEKSDGPTAIGGLGWVGLVFYQGIHTGFGALRLEMGLHQDPLSRRGLSWGSRGFPMTKMCVVVNLGSTAPWKLTGLQQFVNREIQDQIIRQIIKCKIPKIDIIRVANSDHTFASYLSNSRSAGRNGADPRSLVTCWLAIEDAEQIKQ